MLSNSIGIEKPSSSVDYIKWTEYRDMDYAYQINRSIPRLSIENQI